MQIQEDYNEVLNNEPSKLEFRVADILKTWYCDVNTVLFYSLVEFYKYCDDVEGTNVWGGHLEVSMHSH